MWQLIRENPVAFLLSLFMHLTLLAFMVVGLDWREKPRPVVSQGQPIQARTLDASKLQAEVDQLKLAQQQKADAAKQEQEREARRLAELKQEQQKEAERLRKLEAERKQKETEAKQKTEAETKRLDELKAKQEAETKRLQQLEVERKRKEEEAKKQAETEARKKAEAEAKKKAEAEAKKKAELEAKKQAEAEAKKKADAEAKKKAEAEAKRKAEQAAREREMAEQLAAEQEARELDQVIGAISAKVERGWVRPAGTGAGLKCTIRVRLSDSGTVLSARVVRSSGVDAFDRSVEQAVYKADPLPMPQSAGLRAKFREIDFEFQPSE